MFKNKHIDSVIIHFVYVMNCQVFEPLIRNLFGNLPVNVKKLMNSVQCPVLICGRKSVVMYNIPV